MLYALLFIVLFITLIVSSVVFTIRIVKSVGNKKQIIRGVLILAGLSFLSYCGITYYNNKQEVESFRQGVELLKSNKFIKAKIGYFSSYTYFDYNMPNEKDNPAILRVSLVGDKAEIFLTCQVKKDNSGSWHLTKIKQDSIKSAH